MSKYLYTIGHSTHSLEEFIDILHAHKIKQLIDIRTIPRSRYVPWFNKTNLMQALKKEKITYFHLIELGGLRKSHENSINKGWRNSSFRGFADYMQTAEFFSALKQLNLLVKQEKTAIMCAEALPWKCHRSLIADAELIRHWTVIDIMNKHSLHLHKLTSFALVDRSKRPMRIYYPENINSI